MKDTNNLLDYNIWSGTDYSNDITGFSKTPISSNEYSSIGENSLKLTRTTDDYNNYTTEYMKSLPSSNYRLTVDVYSPQAGGNLVMFIGDTVQVNVVFNSSPNVQSLSLQANNTNFRGIRLLNYTKGQSIWFDDFSLVSVP